MKLRIAVIHNTATHVETAISIYFTLRNGGIWDPTVIALTGDSRGLFKMFSEIGVQFTSATTVPSAEHAIVVTAYPKGIEYSSLPGANHPLMRKFENRRILITHRSNYSLSSYSEQKIVGLTPLCCSSNIPYIYPYENPSLRSMEVDNRKRERIFLVQGKFVYGHRNFFFLRKFLKQERLSFKLRIVGEGASSVDFSDDRVERFSDLSESDFYAACGSADFILPLVDIGTRNAEYLISRFSSTYGIVFAGERPVIAHADVNRIYQAPGLEYLDYDSFAAMMVRAITMTGDEYIDLRNQFTPLKIEARRHNQETFEQLLPFPVGCN